MTVYLLLFAAPSVVILAYNFYKLVILKDARDTLSVAEMFALVALFYIVMCIGIYAMHE